MLKNATVPCDPYREIFVSNQYETYFIPLLSHNPVNHDLIIEFLTSEEFLTDYKAIIITSQRCIESLDIVLSKIEDRSVLEIILNKPAYTVGPATFDVLKRLGFRDIRGGIKAGNGAALSEIIINDDLFVQGSTKILFLTGETRKDIIPTKLLAANFDLKELVAYRTDVMADVVDRYSALYKALKYTQSEKWIVFFSPQGTDYITSHLTKNQVGFKIASIGPTTEEYLCKKGIVPDFVAKKPNAQSLFEGIDSKSL